MPSKATTATVMAQTQSKGLTLFAYGEEEEQTHENNAIVHVSTKSTDRIRRYVQQGTDNVNTDTSIVQQCPVLPTFIPEFTSSVHLRG